jgi:hypothetical protein
MGLKKEKNNLNVATEIEIFNKENGADEKKNNLLKSF